MPPPATDLLTPHGRFATAAAGRCAATPFGSVLYTEAAPRWRDGNCVRFEHADDAITARELAAVVDRMQAGGAHRYCEIWDEGLARRLEPGLEALGAEIEDRILLMAAPAAAPAPRPGAAVAEPCDWRELGALYEEWLRTEDEIVRDPALLEMLLWAREHRLRSVPSRAWCVRDPDGSGAPAAMTHLMAHEGHGMLEDVYCTERHRRRGFAGACVVAAVAAAREDGLEPVFLPTDVDGAAPVFYETLGFTRGEVVTRVVLPTAERT